MDQREELAALRRLAELEAKAGGRTAQASTSKIPQRKSAVDNITGALANFNRGLGIGDELAGGAGGLVNTARDIMRGQAGRNPQEFMQNVGQNMQASMAQQRAIEDQYMASNPYAATAAKTAGQGMTMFVPGGQAIQGGRLMNAARGAVTAAVPAAAFGLADRGTVNERIANAKTAAAVGGLIGGGFGAASKTAPSLPATKKVNEDVAMLVREGVPLTPGQIKGGMTRTAEDALMSTPIMGPAIAARRREGVEGFNRAVVNRALKPLGEDLPSNIQTGTEAIKYAGDLISKGYDEALPGVIIADDPTFSGDVVKAFDDLQTLTPENFKRAQDIINNRLFSRLPKDGKITGETYKQIQSGLDFEVRRYGRATDPDQNAIGEALKSVQSALENTARRQDPDFAAKIDALDRGWAELSRLETAGAKSTDMSGVFTPSQYRQAIVSGESRVRNRGVARGEAMSQDLAGAGLRVLPPQMPDSGTASRAMWGSLVGAPGSIAGAAAFGGPPAALGVATGLAATGGALSAGRAAYSPQAIAAANAALRVRVPGPARDAAMAQLQALAARDPAAAQLYQQVAATLGYAVSAAQ